MFERIITPLDGSRLSARALPYAISIAERFDSEILLLRVVSRVQGGYVSESAGIGTPGSVNLIAEQAQTKDIENVAHAKRYLVNRATLLREQGLNVSFHVMEGAPAPSIVKFARDEKASMIIMMSHGRGWLKRAILGSVTDAVVHGSSVPVFVVRHQDNDG
jgi:nucleotide-binding universal stress UspA family protein